MTTHVLVLCTHNSARSVLAEGMLDFWARRLGRDLQAHSAGSAPRASPHPHALAVLAAVGVDTTRLRSKSWDEFARADAPRLRLVITVCDSAAREACPYWPGAPVQVHWGYPDPSNAPPEQQAQRFELTRQAIAYRMRLLAELPFDELDDDALRARLRDLEAL